MKVVYVAERNNLNSFKNIKNDIKLQSFHESIGYYNAFSQYFGLLPVLNVLQSDENKLKFSWKAKRTIYALCWLLLASTEGYFAVKRRIKRGFNVHYVEVIMFFILSPARAAILFNLARHWKNTMQYWRHCEEGFLKYPFEEKGWKLGTKCKIILIVLILQTFGKNLNFWREIFQGVYNIS
jgi:hypothetical protein